MTILGGAGTLLGPIFGAALIKYFENIFSAFNEQTLHEIFGFLPDFIEGSVISVAGLFVGEGWHLTLGVLFMLIVIFLPGGIMEGVSRIGKLFKRSSGKSEPNRATAPAE